MNDKYPKIRAYVESLNKLIFTPEYTNLLKKGTGRICEHTWLNEMDCLSITCDECVRHPNNKQFVGLINKYKDNK